MKTEVYECDICGFKTSSSAQVFAAYLSIGSQKHITHSFHVCTTCYGETPKGVFQKAFNMMARLLGAK